jgi:hypothetical protein
MNEILKTSTPETSPAGARTWMGRILMGVILGEAIWGLLVSVTTNLAVPAMARIMGGDPQSPLYLGKGDISVAPLFTSILELCFALIISAILNAWTQKPTRIRVKTVRVPTPRMPSPVPAPSRPAESHTTPAAETATVMTSRSAPQPVLLSAPQSSPSLPSQPTQAASQPAQSPPASDPAKPKRSKGVYYNIVGEPIQNDDE